MKSGITKKEEKESRAALTVKVHLKNIALFISHDRLVESEITTSESALSFT